jgi:hypothetical protein
VITINASTAFETLAPYMPHAWWLQLGEQRAMLRRRVLLLVAAPGSAKASALAALPLAPVPMRVHFHPPCSVLGRGVRLCGSACLPDSHA